MGEAKFEQKALVKAVESAISEQMIPSADLRVTTPGGRFQVRWDARLSHRNRHFM